MKHVINFQSQFIDAILTGDKKQTIRKKRIREIKVGDDLMLYTGQRTSACRKICEGKVRKIQSLTFVYSRGPAIKLSNKIISKPEAQRLAKKDGFINFEQMVGWFKYHYGTEFYDMKFNLIQWELVS